MDRHPPIDTEPMRLRVRHFVDGRAVTSRSASVYRLTPQAMDRGRHGVPVASPDEVGELVGRCGDGLARWMAIGGERRRSILRRASVALRDHTLDLAEAYADDVDASAVDTVAATSAAIEAMLTTIDESPPSPLCPGIYVHIPSAEYAGREFVPLLWPVMMGGSTLILHPRLDKPRVAQAYATLLSAVGLPDGVVNLVYGDHDTTLALLADPAIAGVLGVGSREHADALSDAADSFGKRQLTQLLTEPIGGPTTVAS